MKESLEATLKDVELTKEATLRNVPQLVPDGIRGVFKFLSP